MSHAGVRCLRESEGSLAGRCAMLVIFLRVEIIRPEEKREYYTTYATTAPTVCTVDLIRTFL